MNVIHFGSEVLWLRGMLQCCVMYVADTTIPDLIVISGANLVFAVQFDVSAWEKAGKCGDYFHTEWGHSLSSPIIRLVLGYSGCDKLRILK